MDDEVEQLLARFRAATRSEPEDPTRQAIFRAVTRRSPAKVATWTIALALAAALVLVWALAGGMTATQTSADATRDQAVDQKQPQENGGDASTRAPVRPVAEVPAPIVVPEPPAPAPLPAPRAIVAPRASTAQPSTQADDDALARESALIRSARTAMSAGDRAAARAALDRHAREFGHGMLARERWVLDIELACAAHDEAGARRKAAAFHAAYPAAKAAKALRDAPCNAVTNPTTSGQLGE